MRSFLEDNLTIYSFISALVIIAPNNLIFMCTFQYFALFVFFQQFGPIIDVEIIFNERGSKVLICVFEFFSLGQLDS